MKAVTPLPPVITQLENAFRYQYEGHPFTIGSCLILKDFGKTWVVYIDNIVNISELPKTSSPYEELETKMNSLTVDEQKAATPGFSIIIPQTKIIFNSSTIESPVNYEENIDISDFGGNQAVLEEVEKMCSSVFRQTSTFNRNFKLNISKDYSYHFLILLT